MKQELSVIIVNFNTISLTKDCIRSILNSRPSFDIEIIVVDNASVPSPDELTEEFPEVILIKSPTNLGFGAANNLGMKKARGRYFLLLNSDTIVQAGCLEACKLFMDDEASVADNIGMIGCKLLNADLSLQPSIFPYLANSLLVLLTTTNPILIRLASLLGLNKHLSFDYSKVQPVGDIAGAFMFMRREVFEKTAGFDPDFFLYGEDTEWCRERIRRHFDIFYYPKAAIIHLGGRSAPEDLMFEQALLSNALMWYKKGPLVYTGFLIVVFLNLATNTMLFPFFGKSAKVLAKKYVKGYREISRQLIFDIPMFRRKFAGRKKPLVTEKGKSVFFRPQTP